MVSLKKLLSADYLFNVDRVILTRSDFIFYYFGIALVLLAIVMKIASTKAPNPVDKHYRQKAFTLFVTIGILEILWFGARYQAIRFFGSHFVALVILCVGIVWAVFLITDIVQHYKPAKEKWEKEQVRQKYLAH